MATSSDVTLLQKFMWYTNPLVLAASAYWLWRRGFKRAFPFFYLYLIFVAVKTYAMIPVKYYFGFSSWEYFDSSWATNALSIGLSFAVLYEVVRNLFTDGTFNIKKSNFLLVNAFLFLLAVTLAFLAGENYHASTIMKAINTVEFSLRFVQVATLLVLGVMTAFFGFYWRSQAFGIAVGFGFYAAVVLMNSAFYWRMGPAYSHIHNVADVLAYYIASLAWLYYLGKKPKLPLTTLPSDKVSQYTQPIERLVQ